MRFWVILVRKSGVAGMPNDPTMRRPFMNPKPKACFRGSQ
jgi:hypothetical protein